jgi:hypothetical protein
MAAANGERTVGRTSVLQKREILGFTLAPLPVLAPLLLMFGLLFLAAQPGESAILLGEMLKLVLAAYGLTILIGLPIHLFLRWRRWNSLRAYLGLSVLGAFLVGGVLAVRQRLSPPPMAENPFGLHMWGRAGIAVAITLAILFALSAWVFWRTAVRRPQS